MTQSSLPKEGIDKDALIAFSYLRNSLHRNGIHKTKNMYFVSNAFIYRFEKDKRIKCADWASIINLLEENVGILSKILLSNNVLIRHEIKDDFVSIK